jgi:hypothetical protein
VGRDDTKRAPGRKGKAGAGAEKGVIKSGFGI